MLKRANTLNYRLIKRIESLAYLFSGCQRAEEARQPGPHVRVVDVARDAPPEERRHPEQVPAAQGQPRLPLPQRHHLPGGWQGAQVHVPAAP